MEQLEMGRSFGSMFLFSLMKVSRGHAYSSRGNSQSLAINADEHLKYFESNKG